MGQNPAPYWGFLFLLHVPVLEPDLNRAFRHVDLICNSLADSGRGCGVLAELHLQGGQLILGGALSLLVLLLLGEGALPRGPSGGRAGGLATGRRRRGFTALEVFITG